MGESCFGQAKKRAGVTQAEGSHGLGRSSLEARTLGRPRPKRARVLAKTSRLHDLIFGLLANGEKPGMGGGTGA